MKNCMRCTVIVFALLVASCGNSGGESDVPVDDQGQNGNVPTALSSRLKFLLYENEGHLRSSQQRLNRVRQSESLDSVNYRSLLQVVIYLSRHEPSHAVAQILDQIEQNVTEESTGFVKIEPPNTSWNRAHECPNGGRLLARISATTGRFSYLDCRVGDVQIDGRATGGLTSPSGDIVTQQLYIPQMTVSYLGQDEEERAFYSINGSEIVQTVDTARSTRVRTEEQRTSLTWRSGATPFEINLTTTARFREYSELDRVCLSSLQIEGTFEPSTELTSETFVLNRDSVGALGFTLKPCERNFFDGVMNLVFHDRSISVSAGDSGNPESAIVTILNDNGASILSLDVPWTVIPLGRERSPILPYLRRLCGSDC